MFFKVADLVIGLLKPIADFTENEKDDLVVKALDHINDGEFAIAISLLSELIDPDQKEE